MTGRAAFRQQKKAAGMTDVQFTSNDFIERQMHAIDRIMFLHGAKDA